MTTLSIIKNLNPFMPIFRTAADRPFLFICRASWPLYTNEIWHSRVYNNLLLRSSQKQWATIRSCRNDKIVELVVKNMSMSNSFSTRYMWCNTRHLFNTYTYDRWLFSRKKSVLTFYFSQWWFASKMCHFNFVIYDLILLAKSW